jgi:alpha-aminoadipate carrier protein LysW
MIKAIESSLPKVTCNVKCPDCDSELEVPFDVKQGELLSCPGCGVELEVTKISNGGEDLELQVFTNEGEDWGE